MKEINKWLSKKGTTHLMLDGGTLRAGEGFLESYISDILHDQRLCVVEQKTAFFRFFVDIDFVSDEHELDFVKVSECLYRIVDNGPCVLARARPRVIEGKGTKYGVHVIWPESKVNKQRANAIRLKILEEMGSDWNDVFDASVYAGSGLRMLWSYKTDIDSTPYIPWGIIQEGNFKEFKNKNPSVEYLKLFSIRVENLPSNVTIEEVSHECSELEHFIRKNIPGQNDAKILKVTPWKKSTKNIVGKIELCLVTNSKYCENIKRCHKSNHVCFRLSSSGILSQRCNDSECKGFKGREYRIPSRLIPNERVLDTSNIRSITDYFPNGWF